VCARVGVDLCNDCASVFDPLPEPCCVICKDPRRVVVLEPEPICENCLNQRPVYDHVRSAFSFVGGARESIHALKYDHRTGVADSLAELLCRNIEQPDGDCLCAVPLHRERYHERGYNQAWLLASALSEHWQMPVLPEMALTRTRPTVSQTTYNLLERRANVKGVFHAEPEIVRGLDIVLVDDVCTTGATLDACASALLSAGTRQVSCVTFARAV